MAIGGSGSAATRFRPRGTGPVAGLGRRNPLVEEDPAEDEEASADQEAAAPQEGVASSPSTYVPRSRRGASASNPSISEDTAHSTARADDGLTSSTSTALNPSPMLSDESTNAPAPVPRKRGRPKGSVNTKPAATRRSRKATVDGALSVSDVRTRMREIEAQARDAKRDFVATKAEFERLSKGLQAEYEALAQTLSSTLFEVE